MPDITAARPIAGAPIESAWGDQVHDLLEGIQAGAGTLVFSAAADSAVLTVVFPRAYAAPPTVVVAGHTGITRAVVAKIVQGSITATQFQAQGNQTAGAAASGNMPFTWLAVGTPA